MNKYICVWKSVGITPLETVIAFKQEYPKYKNEIISYAGRLDPMAEGVLVLLIGEENKNRSKYLKLDKEYDTDIIIGISTDSYDALGLVNGKKYKVFLKNEIIDLLKSFLGIQKQLYPPYSSKTVNGKPLYWWSRNNQIKNITIPIHVVNIYSIKLVRIDNVSASELVDEIINKINMVKGDFRQKEIINKWVEFKKENKEIILTKIKIKVACSSGTYIRVIANDIGNKLGVGAFAFSIKRNKVDKFTKKDCINLKKYI